MRLNTVPNNRKRIINNQEGFTLIEIIAVLVILSILAVVAVPKYFDLQSQAKDKAMQAAMAEAIGRVNGQFARQLLSGQAWDEIVYSTDTDSIGSDLGDFTITSVTDVPATGDDPPKLTIVVEGNAGTAVENATLSRTIPRPGAP
jgi:prepilin-type N-terminal cleavage/methylation domain-containing protein